MKRRIFIYNSMVAFAVAAGGQSFSCSRVNRRKETGYEIKQFEDKGLSQFSYAILADRKVVLIDPARDPQPYYAYAKSHDAEIIAVIETHPHADFVSSHAQIHEERQVPIYNSKLANAVYPHEKFDEGDSLKLTDNLILHALNTPGHSPDSISILLKVEDREVALFSGDALLVGGVGRPDLRAYSGEAATERKKLAQQLYHTVHEKYAKLGDDVVVYPAHGAGSLCGNALKGATQSTIGEEKIHNFAFENRSEQEFVKLLLNDQPYIPKYFPFDVELNKQGAIGLQVAIQAIPRLDPIALAEAQDLIIDTRSSDLFSKSHAAGAINIPDRLKSETWLGTVVDPTSKFYLVVDSESDIEPQLEKVAKIGYEQLIKGVVTFGNYQAKSFTAFNKNNFDSERSKYLVLDVRTEKEAKESPVFANTLNIPLAELDEQLKKIPLDRPLAVHCASGYRSAIAVSIIKRQYPEATVYDVGELVKTYGENKER
ncbi:MBL fold metallo-hydrolase [Sphingobacterium sp. LRF_L2]|uniref:MBL fold metallo-hydrolase n=1 Tax=Sphingobacterium sp. LRF_L2 TaxID=3369421 RepID=UPI003F61FBC1